MKLHRIVVELLCGGMLGEGPQARGNGGGREGGTAAKTRSPAIM